MGKKILAPGLDVAMKMYKKFKTVKVEDAVGMVLGQDITQIVPGCYKGPVFRKGHIIQEKDIPHLKDIGRENIYSIELSAGQLHENDAAARIGEAIRGFGVKCSSASEGSVKLVAETNGLLKIDREAVIEVNYSEEIVVSTKHSNMVVEPGQVVAVAKIIPLVIDEKSVQAVENLVRQRDIVRVQPMARLRVASIITGNEVYFGRIEDKYGSVIRTKIKEYGAADAGVIYHPDESELINKSILAFKDLGVDVIIACGGMSVDPDDVTPEAIRATGAEVVTYGIPVFPGAMFMLAYLENTVLIGLPACGIFSKTTVLDLVLPRILAGERLTKKEITSMGYGGLCYECKVCRFPHCPFGK